jgi:hypothetical protein
LLSNVVGNILLLVVESFSRPSTNTEAVKVTVVLSKVVNETTSSLYVTVISLFPTSYIIFVLTEKFLTVLIVPLL